MSDNATIGQFTITPRPGKEFQSHQAMELCAMLAPFRITVSLQTNGSLLLIGNVDTLETIAKHISEIAKSHPAEC